MSEDTVAILAVVLILVFTAAFIAWYFRQSDAHLERWAQENGYQIVGKERRYLRRGPFLLGTTRSQAVFYVEVIDTAGRQHRGWVRVGAWWWGVLKYKATVQWDLKPDDPTAALR